MNDARRDHIPANERDFKGAYIPKEIWCSPELSGDEKLMWGEIFSLDNDFGCVASNRHFMEMFGFNNERKPQRLIKQLKDKGYITVQVDKRDDQRVIRIVGKYRHMDKDHMANLLSLREDLLGKMRR
ncbi:helix-turn-helix domain-containing protein [uncultured Tateyamaria sp.]|uniref:helix-turn-helix domain-containing protein n=1 Tax=uncultured Tateyamaria sp. TaxID=455651 RepID=UPI00262CC490|nr:helix-turn-helix domain-containing protein [uncultured Tateyamaria sp.]